MRPPPLPPPSEGPPVPDVACVPTEPAANDHHFSDRFSADGHALTTPSARSLRKPLALLVTSIFSRAEIAHQ